MKAHWIDSVFQTVLGIAAVAAVNRLLYHDRMIVAVGYAVALIGAFWLGRGCVKLIKGRKKIEELTDE